MCYAKPSCQQNLFFSLALFAVARTRGRQVQSSSMHKYLWPARRRILHGGIKLTHVIIFRAYTHSFRFLSLSLTGKETQNAATNCDLLRELNAQMGKRELYPKNEALKDQIGLVSSGTLAVSGYLPSHDHPMQHYMPSRPLTCLVGPCLIR